MSNSSRIQIQSLSKTFTRSGGETFAALDNVSIDVLDGDFLVLLGPSGCGKTTLLRSIAGLETINSGSISLNGTMVTDHSAGSHLRPERRSVSMMFQSYALWPHLTIKENVAFPLTTRIRARGRKQLSKSERDKKVQKILEMVGIPTLQGQYPSQISGGQQQRVALARALVGDESVILFDEPLSNVDAKVREHLREELAKLHRQLGFTAVYVTHDQDDAVILGTRIAIMNEGRIVQVGTPTELYERPNSAYVARFMGATNEFSALLAGPPDHSTGAALANTNGETIRGTYRNSGFVEGRLNVFSRPEKWKLISPAESLENAWPGRVVNSTYMGFFTDYLIDTSLAPITVRTLNSGAESVGSNRSYSVGDDVVAYIHPDDVLFSRD